MRIYLSGGFVYMRHWELEKGLQAFGVKNRLYSYFYVRKRSEFSNIFKKLIDEEVINVMIDSGAHSVATTKEEVKVEEYGKWLVSLGESDKRVYVNLDVAPFRPGDLIPTAERYEKSASEGWENLKYLESLGLKPIHVFHGGEDWKWFNKLVDNYEYIGLAASIGEKYGWLDSCWKRLLDYRGKPLRKVHGFALTSPEIMVRYPWFSLDSSSWNQFGVYGEILIPIFDKARLTYRHVAMSPHSPAQRKSGGHYNSLSEEERKAVDSFLEECGVSSEQILNESVGSLLKDRVNIRFLTMMEEEINRRRQGQNLSFQRGFFE